MSEAAELVRMYSEEQRKFEDLVAYVKCQECFSNLMNQITEQMGSDSGAAASMANQFPEMWKAYGRETGFYNDAGGEEEAGAEDGGED